jgi:putative transcriptional regulator
MNSIKKIRKLLGVTQSDLAGELDVTQGNVSLYEHGQTVPPHIAARIISLAINRGHKITFDDIYTSKKSSNKKTEKANKCSQF